MSESEEQRIAREESYWNAPRLFTAGIVFLGVCIVVIYLMATFAFSNAVG